MATVRISQALIENVRDNIRRARSTEISRATNGEPIDTYFGDEAVLLAEELLWGKYYHLRNSTPAEWMKEMTGIGIFVHDTEGKVTRINLSIANGGRSIFAPPSFSHYDFPRVRPDNPKYAQMMEYVGKMREKQKEIDAVMLRYSEIERQVLAFLRSCKSLNDAVTKFPDVVLWVSPYYKDRLEEKVERPSRKPVEPPPAVQDLDKKLIVAAGVLNAITKS